MLLKKSRFFFFKLKGCRSFCDNTKYINNSYLNYVQVNKNANDKSDKDNTRSKDKAKINNENANNLKSFKCLNDLNNKPQNYSNNPATNFENCINDIENKQKIVETHDEFNTMTNESLGNAYNSPAGEGIREKDYFYQNNEEYAKEDFINNKSKKYSMSIGQDDDYEKCNRNDNDNANRFNNINNLNSRLDIQNNNKKENLYDYKNFNYGHTEKKANDLNDDAASSNAADLNDNSSDTMYNKINYSNYPNDSFDKNEFESLNEKKNGNSSNEPLENSEKWIDNEEDIQNIFEVDENLSEEEKKEKLKLIKLITEKLEGPLRSNNKDNSKNDENSKNEDSIFGDNRPIAIEVDGPSHFYANSNRYTTYTKLKHRILTKLGYNVIHISYIDWRKLRNKSEREEFILKKLKEKNDEFLDENDRVYYNERMNMIKDDYTKYLKQKKEKSE